MNTGTTGFSRLSPTEQRSQLVMAQTLLSGLWRYSVPTDQAIEWITSISALGVLCPN